MEAENDEEDEEDEDEGIRDQEDYVDMDGDGVYHDSNVVVVGTMNDGGNDSGGALDIILVVKAWNGLLKKMLSSFVKERMVSMAMLLELLSI